MNTPGNSVAQADDAALAWIARLRSDAVSESDRQAFALWLAESDANRKAMDAAEALWGDIGAILAARPLETARFSLRRWVPSAVAAAATLLLGILFWPDAAHQPDGDTYRTAKGERVEITLPDGSHALLNTETVIHVAYDEDERLVSLHRGQAWFSVEKNPQKPFLVDAGDTRVTALGTAFDVYRHTGSSDSPITEVTVTEGVVRVTAQAQPGNPAPAAEILHRNQALSVSTEGWKVTQRSEQAVQQQLAWREGRLVAASMPLPELLNQLKRYDDTNYILADAGLNTLTVSGVFNLDQPEAILHAVEVSLNLEAQQVNEKTVQLVRLTDKN